MSSPAPAISAVERRLSLPATGASPETAGQISILELGRSDGPVDLIFLHANGFNASTYRRLLSPLAAERRLWLMDQRGHGLTTLAAQPGRRGWQDLRDDLVAVLDTLEGRPLLAGHSMGGTVALLAAAERPERVRGLVLADPVVWPRLITGLFHLPGGGDLPRRSSLVRNARRRRAVFDDPQTALKAYRGRGAFRDWPETVLADYLETGLRAEAAGWVLSCNPAWEADNYGAQTHNPWRALAAYRGPVNIVKAEKGSTCRVPDRPFGLAHVRARTVPGATHFLPMVAPDPLRALLQAGLQPYGVAHGRAAR